MAAAAKRSTPQPENPAAAEPAAALWLARQDRGLTPEEATALAAWLARDARHAAAWARLGGTWHDLSSLASDTDLQHAADCVVQQAAARRARRANRWRHWCAAASLAAAAALGVLLWSPWSGSPPAADSRLQVIASAARRLPLPDGSVAELNGDSRIETHFTAQARHVRLLQGEAHFIVAKDSARPFYVQAGDVAVRAVGTAFNVRLQTERIEVLVTEGHVQVEDNPVASGGRTPTAIPPAPAPTTAGEAGTARSVSADAPLSPAILAPPPPPLPARRSALGPGQQAIIARRAAPTEGIDVRTLSTAEMAEALSWQATRLVFNQTPLAEVVAAFNRHNRVQLRLGDAQLAQRRITGIFRADNLEGFTRLAQAIVDVRAETVSAEETVLWPGP